MTTKSYNVTTAETQIPADATRTALVIQNLDTEDYVYVSDESDSVLNEGLRINPGGSITLNLLEGHEPQKAWHLVSNATAEVRVLMQYLPMAAIGGGSTGGGGSGGTGNDDKLAFLIPLIMRV